MSASTEGGDQYPFKVGPTSRIGIGRLPVGSGPAGLPPRRFSRRHGRPRFATQTRRRRVHDDVAETGTAYGTLIPILGSGAAGVFLVSLLASGLSSSAVGTMAGQVIMQGFVGFRIPLSLRRLVTMVPFLSSSPSGSTPPRR
jgi:hypothetical protein